jgi:serine protease Do
MIVPINEDLIIKAIENASKTVVNISSVRMIQDQLFRVFPVEGVGSGIIVDEKGYILTNNHVVDKAHKLKITFTDGNIFNGAAIGADPVTDLAVVKVDSKEALAAAPLGNSDELKIGQIVVAIGNPFGLTGGPKVTQVL